MSLTLLALAQVQAAAPAPVAPTPQEPARPEAVAPASPPPAAQPAGQPAEPSPARPASAAGDNNGGSSHSATVHPPPSSATAQLPPSRQEPTGTSTGMIDPGRLSVEGAAGPILLHAGAEQGLGLRTRDGNWSFSFGFVTQPRYDLRLGNTTSTMGFTASGMGGFGLQVSDFEARMMRPQLRMSLFRPWVRVFIQPEFAGTPRLLDLQFDVQPIPEFGVRVGQFVTPFSRAFIVPIPVMQFPDFSFAEAAFRGDRAPGAMLFGNVAGGRFEYDLGFFNANGLNVGNNNTLDEMVMARVVASPLGQTLYNETLGLSRTPTPFRIALGLNAFYNRVTRPTTATTPGEDRNVTAGFDLAMYAGAWHFNLEGYYRSTWGTNYGSMGAANVNQPQRHQAGGFLQTGGFLVPHIFELAMRLNFLNTDVTGSSCPAMGACAGFNTLGGEALATWYVVGNHLKFWARYAIVSSDRTVTAAPSGVTHQLTLQMQLFL